MKHVDVHTGFMAAPGHRPPHSICDWYSLIQANYLPSNSFIGTEAGRLFVLENQGPSLGQTLVTQIYTNFSDTDNSHQC